MPRRPHPEQDAIIAAYRAGAAVPAVAQQFGLSVNTVYNRLGRATVPLRPRSRRVPLAPVVIAALSTAYRTGETLGALATQFDVSQETVARALRAAGGTERARRTRRTASARTPTAGAG